MYEIPSNSINFSQIIKQKPSQLPREVNPVEKFMTNFVKSRYFLPINNPKLLTPI